MGIFPALRAQDKTQAGLISEAKMKGYAVRYNPTQSFGAQSIAALLDSKEKLIAIAVTMGFF